MTEGMSLPDDTALGLPNCGVVAVAVAAGVRYRDARSTIHYLSGYSGNWKGRTRHRDRIAALKAFGVKYTELEAKQSWAVEWPRRITLQRWIDRHATPGVLYMIDTTGHTQLVKDGIILDQGGARPVSKHWGRRKRIRSIIRIDN